ncbi:hypothetical protein JKP88DRAFT_163730 [Tribonema minus]|uniref:HTH myb-type domain-containing protein n=1 Tax=Tribonema minus TaxID=303371 RepID=A0A835YYE3_9STRA|nr:hypothetical protein JKP88DRAFT_163730 [Tribonema minus]
MPISVAERGTKKWAEIATHIPGRSNKQRRERWLNQLDPTISKITSTTKLGANLN